MAAKHLPANVVSWPIWRHSAVPRFLSRLSPLFVRFCIFVLLPLALGSLWLVHKALDGLPEQKTLLIKGVSSPVTITRDKRGVPLIVGQTAADAAFAVGYAQAQDRLWQLELQRRTTNGRLAEVLGQSALRSDIWHRVLNLRGAAVQAYPRLSPEARLSLEAYARGVNAWIAEAKQFPIEFALLGIRPEPWTAIDSLAWMKAFAYDLGGNMDRELDYALAREWLGQRRTSALFPGYQLAEPALAAEQLAGDVDAVSALAEFRAKIVSASRRTMAGTGSNAWAVSGRLTADGSAILANDPHLGITIPGAWYAQAVRSPQWAASGMAIVGLPVIVFGRNHAIAWAGTNMMADVQDLYVERISPDGRQYFSDDRWNEFNVRIENIQIKADWPAGLHPKIEPLTLRVRSTRHGPLISDVVQGFGRPFSLRWTGHDADDTSYEAFYQINRASDWNGFRSAAGLLVAPTLNFLFADMQGHIGFQAAGRIPRRAAGSGTAPLPGWTQDWDWQGSVPDNELPAAWNPEGGILVSANDRPVEADFRYLSADWASPARARRIAGLLDEIKAKRTGFTVRSMATIQGDNRDLDADQLNKALVGLIGQDRVDARVLRLLAGWSGEMNADSAAAAIFRMWTYKLREAFARADPLRPLPGSAERERYARIIHSADALALHRMLSAGSGWCTLHGSSGCQQLARQSLRQAMRELAKLTGYNDPTRWRLENIQMVDYQHPPFTAIRPFDRLFGALAGSSGSENAINVAGVAFYEAKGFRKTFGAGFRQVITLQPRHSEQWYMLATGQSGNPVSPHYKDMIDPFKSLELYSMDLAATPPPNQMTKSD